MDKFSRRGALHAALVPCFTVAMTAVIPTSWAQEPDRRATTIEEVVVTARRVEESLQDTPVSVAAFTSQDLQQMGVSEAGDIASFTPNLEMRKQTSSVDNYSFSIRGVSAAETALAIDPTVGVYVDGVYIARQTGLAFDIVDMRRIEVLRGPQGTLFGRNTIGGAINIVTKKPDGEFGFTGEAGTGNQGRERYKATIDTPRVAGVAAKLSLLRVERGAELTSAHTGGDLGQQESDAGRLALNWQPAETVTVDYAFDVSRRENNPQLEQLTFVRPGHVAAGGPYYAEMAANSSPDRLSQVLMRNTEDDISSSDIDNHALTVEWVVNPNLTIKSISSYREWDHEASPSSFGSIASDGATVLDAATFSPIAAGTLVPFFDADRDSEQRQKTQELQFIGSLFDGRLEYTTGLYYFEEQADEFNPQRFTIPTCFVAPTPCGTTLFIQRPFFDYSTDNESYAIYGEFTYLTPIPRLEVTLGYRYTKDERETTLTNTLKDTPSDPDTSATLRTVTDDDTWSNFNPSLTVNYRWSDAISSYGKVTTGYRSGGYNVRASDVQSFRDSFDEENVISYELGMKSDLLDRTLRLNAAVFYLDYEDRQIASFAAGSGGASSIILNAGKSTTKGLELDAQWRPLPGLRVLASYGYLDVEFKEFVAGELNPQTGFATGNFRDISDQVAENLYAAENSGSLALEYQFAPMSWGTVTVRADANYTDDIVFHPQLNLFNSSESHTLVNGRVTLSEIPAGDSGSLRVSAWGKNLNNEEYREFGIDFGALGWTTNTFGYLRHWGVDLVYEFAP